MLAYYNEIDADAVWWLKVLDDVGEITHGAIDGRSIRDVAPVDVRGFRRVHWFAGIGGWDLALQLAEWPEERAVGDGFLQRVDSEIGVVIGSRFGSLTVLEVSRGAKNVHPTAMCECDCGERRSVRQSSLRRGLIDCCARCSMKRAWARRPRISRTERELCNKESEYKANARSRGLDWQLDRETFRALYAAPCTYCGETPAKGVDRADNGEGYAVANAVSCCSTCNYAKRGLSQEDFLEWVARVFRHSCG